MGSETLFTLMHKLLCACVGGSETLRYLFILMHKYT